MKFVKDRLGKTSASSMREGDLFEDDIKELLTGLRKYGSG
jgi:hypothetical protein